MIRNNRNQHLLSYQSKTNCNAYLSNEVEEKHFEQYEADCEPRLKNCLAEQSLIFKILTLSVSFSLAFCISANLKTWKLYIKIVST